MLLAKRLNGTLRWYVVREIIVLESVNAPGERRLAIGVAPLFQEAINNAIEKRT